VPLPPASEPSQVVTALRTAMLIRLVLTAPPAGA
jgi:hypothetical protein